MLAPGIEAIRVNRPLSAATTENKTDANDGTINTTKER
jgi:hypothetical protein